MSEVKITDIRKACEDDFTSFVLLVAPYNVMGQCHRDLCDFLQNTTSMYKLVLYPRGHRKSFYAAMYAAWRIVKNPAISILYVSATSALAEMQLRIIKQVLESSKVRMYWKDLVDPEEGKREKWTASEICVDHPKRKKEGTRDSTVKAAGLTTNTTGSHADLIIFDDTVVPDNNNELGRKQVESQYSQMFSILNPNGEMLAVGTRYDPKDLYNTLMNTQEDIYNKDGEFTGRRNQWAVLQKVVEVDGEFLWNRTRRADGKYFGFDAQILASIKAGYIDKLQFYAQYYNNPNDASLAKISPEMFTYYDKEKLSTQGGNWYIGSELLNTFAAFDFAYSLTDRADWSCIVVIGIDSYGRYYVLDIYRFKTDLIQEYYKQIMAAHSKYNLKKLRAETTAAQAIIVKQLKKKLEENNVRLVIEEYKPTSNKAERIDATLRPLYEDLKILHYRGGNCELLEEELKSARPEHDDIKNALADAIEIAVKPSARYVNKIFKTPPVKRGRFGGL